MSVEQSMTNPETLGAQIDAVQLLRLEKKGLTAQAEAVQTRIDAAEAALLETMVAAGVTRASGMLASASVGEAVVPHVQDWDAFYKYIKDNDYFHLLDRRPNSAGCREIFEKHGLLPGVVPFTKRRVSLKTT